MRIHPILSTLALPLLVAGCVSNTAPGNDREAELEPAAPAAPMASAAEATANVEPSLLFPETMTDADVRAAGSTVGNCRFRFTRVGFPVLLYSDGGTAVVKMNGKLIPLQPAGAGHFADAGVDITLRPLDDAELDEPQFASELVLRLAGAPDELGFQGFAECTAA